MDATEDVGSAITGQRVDPANAMSQWDDYLNRPGNRQALLQMGLQMMQPVGIGQTVGGHIAQSVGAGGEAVDRNATQDLKERVADQRMEIANEKLRIAQQNADSNNIRAGAAAARAGAKKVGGLTDLMRMRFARQDEATNEKNLLREAKEIDERVNKQDWELTEADKKDPLVTKYRGKLPTQIKEMLKAERGATTPSVAADDDEDAAPPVEGAQKAADGNWYKPDPARPGKYLLVKR